jgi:biotin transporter BioY
MLTPILIFDVALVAWSLHLMQSALERQEFSLMLAGTLVGTSAGALLVVYFIINSCIGRLS